jgi:hypothetical protein
LSAPKPPADDPPLTQWVDLQAGRDEVAPAPAAPVTKPAQAPAEPPRAAPPATFRRRPPAPSDDHAALGGTFERWDVVIAEVHGEAVHTLAGPTIKMGRAPGPGGLAFVGAALLDTTHAVLDVTDGVAVLYPAGNSVVYAAASVDELARGAPVRAPLHIDAGTIVHLGPLHRGVTLRLDEVRRVGARVAPRGLVADTTAFLRGGHIATQVTRRPYDALVAGAFVGLALVAVAAAGLWFMWSQRGVDPLGPIYDTEERYSFVGPGEPADPPMHAALAPGFEAFVMAPNAAAAAWPELAGDRAAWDEALYARVSRSAAAHARQWPFWRRLEAVRGDYAATVGALRRAGLPEVLAAIPFYATGYRADARGPACELGPWQLVPELALRGGLGVRDCTIRGVDLPWNPDAFVPAARPAYLEAGTCRLAGCATDERGDVLASAGGAARLLADAWRDPAFAASGAAVQLTIASHFAGYDDARFDAAPHPTNILPAYRGWLVAKGAPRAAAFVGDNLRCEKPGAETCGGVLTGDTQHAVYSVIAQHLLAVCYYGRNHARSQVEFAEWAGYGSGYCVGVRVPDSGG